VREPTCHELLAQAAQGIMPFSVHVTGVGHSDQLFKTVFLRLAPSDELRALHERIRASLSGVDDYVLEPHLSLIYKELPLPARERIARSIRPPESFVCDALSVVVPGPAGWTDVPSWRARVQVVFQ
jgi:hypothetical protein